MLHQEKVYNTLKSAFPEESGYVQSAKQQLDLYLKLSVSYEKHKSATTRPIGQNRQPMDP